jgi:hypothetical protein
VKADWNIVPAEERFRIDEQAAQLAMLLEIGIGQQPQSFDVGGLELVHRRHHGYAFAAQQLCINHNRSAACLMMHRLQ